MFNTIMPSKPINNSNNIYTTNLESVITQFIKLSDGKHISVFTGAGISFNSGLPLASRLVEYILSNLTNNGSDIIKEPLSYLPFEGYIEQMIIDSNNDTIMQMFTEKSLCPNKNHRFIARLHKIGAINRIYTVNFDILHEKAFDELNIRCNKISRDKDLTSDSYLNDSINLIKLHGCGTDIESMKFVLSSVTARENRTQREYLTKKIFGNPDEIIIICGYSASDNFDIVPAIKSIKEKKATVIYISHDTDAGESAKIITHQEKYDDYIFSDFPGIHVLADTTNFLKAWYNRHNYVDDVPTNNEITYNWASYIQPFISSLLKVRYKFLGTICYQAGMLHDAKMYFEEDVKCNQRAYSHQLLAQLALISNNKDDYIKSIGIAKDIATNENDIYTYIGCLFNEAEYNIQIDNLASAIDLYIEAYMYASLNCWLNQMSMALKGLSYVYAEKKDYKRSKFYGMLVISLNDNDDNLREKSDSYINYAEILRKSGDIKTAIEYIDMAIEQKQILHDIISLLNAKLAKANILKDQNNIKAAKKLYDEALDKAIECDIIDITGKILHQRASLFFMDDNFSIDYFRDAYNSYVFFEKSKNIRYCLSALELLQNMIITIIYNKLKCIVSFEGIEDNGEIISFDLETFSEMSELPFSWEELEKWLYNITTTKLEIPKTFQILDNGRKFLEDSLRVELTIIKNTNNWDLYNKTIQEWRNKGII